MDPGIANISRPSSLPNLAVMSEPDRSAASITRIPAERAAMMRFRRGKWHAFGPKPGASSEIRSPHLPIALANSMCSRG